jgi:branched-chain amino acid transport system substrate-binding protein
MSAPLRSLRCGLLAVAALLAPAAADAEIVIGLGGALTGQAAWEGEQHLVGVEAAVADINAAGGLLGEELVLVVGDDACDAGQAAAVARQLVAAGAVFVSGHVCSHASLAAAPVYEIADVVMISPASTAPALTEAGHDYVFRVCGRDDGQGEVAADRLAERWGDRRIVILHDGTVFGEGLAREAKRHLNARGVREAMFAGFTPARVDYTTLAREVIAAAADVVYVVGYIRDVALVVRQLRAEGSDAAILSAELVGDEFWLIAGAAGEGVRFTFGRDAREDPAAATVVERLRAGGFEPAGYTLPGYASVQVWAQAVERAGSLDPDAVAAALHAGTFDTVLGPLGFDARGDVTGIETHAWFAWRDGVYEQLSGP